MENYNLPKMIAFYETRIAMDEKTVKTFGQSKKRAKVRAKVTTLESSKEHWERMTQDWERSIKEREQQISTYRDTVDILKTLRDQNR